MPSELWCPMKLPENRILSLSSLAEDAQWLGSIDPPAPWRLESCATVESALAELSREDIAVVLCDCDGDPDAWHTLLAGFPRLARPPCLIVTSRLADERLWAEALNLGAYDVLAKPFDSREVLHALSRALVEWSSPASVPCEAAPGNHARTVAA